MTLDELEDILYGAGFDARDFKLYNMQKAEKVKEAKKAKKAKKALENDRRKIQDNLEESFDSFKKGRNQL